MSDHFILTAVLAWGFITIGILQCIAGIFCCKDSFFWGATLLGFTAFICGVGIVFVGVGLRNL